MSIKQDRVFYLSNGKQDYQLCKYKLVKFTLPTLVQADCKLDIVSCNDSNFDPF